MKSLFVLSLTLSFLCSFSQSKKPQSCDSIRVSLERTAIIKELIPFRDSIYLFIKIIDAQIGKSAISKRSELEKLKEELIEFRTYINLDIRETSLISPDCASDKFLESMQVNTASALRQYKRLREKLKINRSEFNVQ